jgi:hypothetical protein
MMNKFNRLVFLLNSPEPSPFDYAQHDGPLKWPAHLVTLSVVEGRLSNKIAYEYTLTHGITGSAPSAKKLCILCD